MTYHNKYGLMGGSEIELARVGEVDRSQVLPFSVVMFDETEGWQQYGVYRTEGEARAAQIKLTAEYQCETAVVDTNKLLDCAVLSDEPLMSLEGLLGSTRLQ